MLLKLTHISLYTIFFIINPNWAQSVLSMHVMNIYVIKEGHLFHSNAYLVKKSKRNVSYRLYLEFGHICDDMCVYFRKSRHTHRFKYIPIHIYIVM